MDTVENQVVCGKVIMWALEQLPSTETIGEKKKKKEKKGLHHP